MKNKIIIKIVIMSTIALLLSCAGVSKVKAPKIPVPEKTGEPYGIKILYEGKDAGLMDITISVGQSIELEAWINDENFKIIKNLMPKWYAEDLVEVGTWQKSDAALKIEPEAGNKVKVTVIGKGLVGKGKSKPVAEYVRPDGKVIKESGPFITIK